MLKIKSNYLFFLLTILTVFLVACGGGDDPAPAVQQSNFGVAPATTAAVALPPPPTPAPVATPTAAAVYIEVDPVADAPGTTLIGGDPSYTTPDADVSPSCPLDAGYSGTTYVHTNVDGTVTIVCNIAQAGGAPPPPALPEPNCAVASQYTITALDGTVQSACNYGGGGTNFVGPQ